MIYYICFLFARFHVTYALDTSLNLQDAIFLNIKYVLRKSNAYLQRLLTAAAELKRHAHQVGGDGGVVPGADIELGIGGLRANLKVGVAQGVADGVNADEGASAQKIDSLKITGSGGVELCPLAIDVLGQKIHGIHGLLGGATRGQSIHGGAGAAGGGILHVL